MLCFPVVLYFELKVPIAVLLFPNVLKSRTSRPIATFPPPVVLRHKAECPIAVLEFPVVLHNKVLYPIAVLWDPDVLKDREFFPIAVLCCPVAEELKFVVAPIEIFVGTFPPPVLISKLLIEPVTPKDPVIKALPVNGKAAPPPPFNANDAVSAYEALTILPLKYEAVTAYEALNACVAYDAVPKSELVIPFDTVSEFSEAFEPDTTTLFQFGI